MKTPQWCFFEKKKKKKSLSLWMKFAILACFACRVSKVAPTLWKSCKNLERFFFVLSFHYVGKILQLDATDAGLAWLLFSQSGNQ